LTGEGLVGNLADIGLSIATVWIVYRLTEVLFDDRRAALIAALFAAVYPHFIFFASVRLTETPYIFLLCGAFLLLYLERYAAAAVLLVLTILVRPTLEPLLPVLVFLFAWLVHGRSAGFALKRVAVLAVIYVVLMTPWWIHNYERYGEFVRLSLGLGVPLYNANNPYITEGGRTYFQDLDEKHGFDGMDSVERIKAMRAKGFDFIRENPGRFVELAGERFLRFWRLWPYTDQYKSPLTIATSVLSFVPVLALALWFLARRLAYDWRRLSPILLFTVFLTAVHMVVVASIRFRFPIEPFLIVLAAAQAAHLLRYWPWAERLFGDKD
jgi:4-amino-4-deoxy-L-arabinose transferase-like glycosyltransferase